MYKSRHFGGSNRTNFHRGTSHRGSSRKQFNGSKIHPSKYIQEAIQVEEEVYTPSLVFEQLPIDQKLKVNIFKKGYELPTPIQDKTIPHIVEGNDVIGIANTGTGKTAAFLIPLINKITKNKQETVLILVPTRELAQQIRDELRSLTQGMNIYSTLCIGGASMRQQIVELTRNNPEFVIGTPGRVKDLIERKVINMSVFTAFVLDEVDRMLDMGFVREIKYLISLLPDKRQSLFFSATLSPEINTIIHSFMVNPVTVSVKSGDTSHNVEQNIVRIGDQNRLEILHDLLSKEDFKKVLIFGRTKWGVEKLSKILVERGFKANSLHGDKPQNKRQIAIRQFKENEVNILVATDVAARGIDIPDITHVINYDEPTTYEDYVHRIGRTGRGNNKGMALTFVA
jgi:superfamily II DNA/RNA helicase